MYQETIRDMTEAERATLSKSIKHTQMLRGISQRQGHLMESANSFFNLGTVLIAGCGVVIFLMNSRWQVAIIGIPILILFAVLARLSNRVFHPRNFIDPNLEFSLFKRGHTSLVEQALDDGKVLVRIVLAKAVIEFSSYDEETVGYAFDIGEDGLLFLNSIDDSMDPQEDRWPNSNFELVVSHSGNLFLNLEIKGTPLTPARVLSADEYDSEKLWELKEEPISSDLESLVISLRPDVTGPQVD